MVDLQKVPLGDKLVDGISENQFVLDNAEDGVLTGEVKFILYKGKLLPPDGMVDWDGECVCRYERCGDDGDRVWAFPLFLEDIPGTCKNRRNDE